MPWPIIWLRCVCWWKGHAWRVIYTDRGRAEPLPNYEECARCYAGRLVAPPRPPKRPNTDGA